MPEYSKLVTTSKLTGSRSDSLAQEQPVSDRLDFAGPMPEADGEGMKLYTGNCHCGDVSIAVRTKPIPEIEVKQDNCSICCRVSTREAQAVAHCWHRDATDKYNLDRRRRHISR